MQKRESYHTKQKEKVVHLIKEQQKELTIKEIYELLNKEVGLTTIYRIIDKLVNDGVVNQSIGKNNITYYQYLEECKKENHFYLKCEVCSKLIHVDCDCIKELSEHIGKRHGLKPTKSKVIIEGICDKCNNRKKRRV